MPNKNKDLLYLRFLNFLDALGGGGGKDFPLLDPHEEILLNKIMLLWSEDLIYTVGELILLKEIASPATIHVRLKKLRAKGYLETLEEEDSRIKKIVPSKLALRRYQLISNQFYSLINH